MWCLLFWLTVSRCIHVSLSALAMYGYTLQALQLHRVVLGPTNSRRVWNSRATAVDGITADVWVTHCVTLCVTLPWSYPALCFGSLLSPWSLLCPAWHVAAASVFWLPGIDHGPHCWLVSIVLGWWAVLFVSVPIQPSYLAGNMFELSGGLW